MLLYFSGHYSRHRSSAQGYMCAKIILPHSVLLSNSTQQKQYLRAALHIITSYIFCLWTLFYNVPAEHETLCWQNVSLSGREYTPGIPLFIHCIEKVRKRESVWGSFHLYSDIQLKPGPATATLDP